MTTAKENEIHRKLYDISMAATMIRINANKAKGATPEKLEEIYKSVVKDALFIEGLATSINGGHYNK